MVGISGDRILAVAAALETRLILYTPSCKLVALLMS